MLKLYTATARSTTDGRSVFIQTSNILHYQYQSAGRHEATLSGQAFFHLVHGKRSLRRAYIVSTMGHDSTKKQAILSTGKKASNAGVSCGGRGGTQKTRMGRQAHRRRESGQEAESAEGLLPRLCTLPPTGRKKLCRRRRPCPWRCFRRERPLFFGTP